MSTPAGATNYAYNKIGQLVSKTDAGGQWTYAYDYEGSLASALLTSATGTTNVTFKYDPFGRRIEKRADVTVAGVITTTSSEYVYDGQNIVIEYETTTANGATAVVTKRYVHGPGTDEHLAMEKGGKVYYLHSDGLGSITSVTDKTDKVVESYTYDAYGNFKKKGGRAGSPYAFTGREYDNETGLYYYRARYYDASIGRFITRDPIGFAGGINVYNYVGANPIRFTDPEGLIIQLATDSFYNGTNQQAIAEYQSAIKYLNQSPELAKLIKKLDSSTAKYTVVISGSGRPKGIDYFDPKTNTIVWDPVSALFLTNNGKISPALILAHEFAHANNSWFDKLARALLPNFLFGDYENYEEWRVITGIETRACKTFNEGNNGVAT